MVSAARCPMLSASQRKRSTSTIITVNEARIDASVAIQFKDAMRALTNADVAITNGGGIRGDKVYDASVRSRYNTLTRQHRHIVDAIAARDGELAARAMADHLNFARDRIGKKQ